MAKRYKVKPVEVNYENDLGHVIKPGDGILVVTTGYCHSVSVRTGIYLGKTKDDTDEEYEASVIVLVDEERKFLRHKETGEDFDWEKHISQVVGQSPQHPTLHWNRSEWGKPRIALTPEQIQDNERMMSEYKAAKEVFDTKKEAEMKKFHYVYEPYTRRSTLQRNRIYPINMPLKDFIRKI